MTENLDIATQQHTINLISKTALSQYLVPNAQRKEKLGELLPELARHDELTPYRQARARFDHMPDDSNKFGKYADCPRNHAILASVDAIQELVKENNPQQLAKETGRLLILAMGAKLPEHRFASIGIRLNQSVEDMPADVAQEYYPAQQAVLQLIAAAKEQAPRPGKSR